MKKTNIFLGNEICCGTYAFLNTVQDAGIDYKLFEITSTVPFGISHRKEEDYSRLLTTYCDPNIGLDRAAEFWSYKQEKETFYNSKEAEKYILDITKTNRCLVGPLDMEKLGYLILPNLYANMDHYITIFRQSGELFCMDSEAIPVKRITRKELGRWLEVGNLPEAKGQINVRSYTKSGCYSEKSRKKNAISHSFKLIIKNLTESSEKRQGNYAIENCWQWLKEKPVEKWRLPFLYDVSFLIQRKMLQEYWQKLACELHLLNKDAAHEMESIIQKQIDVLGEMFHALQCERTIHEQDFSKLAELERNLIKQV